MDATNGLAIEHGTLDGEGVRLHYAAAGEGPLIVFIHGFPEFWYAWRRLIGINAISDGICRITRKRWLRLYEEKS